MSALAYIAGGAVVIAAAVGIGYGLGRNAGLAHNVTALQMCQSNATTTAEEAANQARAAAAEIEIGLRKEVAEKERLLQLAAQLSAEHADANRRVAAALDAAKRRLIELEKDPDAKRILDTDIRILRGTGSVRDGATEAGLPGTDRHHP